MTVDKNKEGPAAERQIFDDLFENAPVGYVVLSPEGRINRVNPVGAALLGEERTALAGAWFGLFVSEPDLQAFQSFLQNALRHGGRENCEIGIDNRRERLLFVHMEGMATSDGSECCAMMRDVTESRIVKQSMSFNESKYRALFENINVAFSYHRVLEDEAGQVRDSVVLDANPVYASMLGKPLTDIIGRRKSEVGLFSLTTDFDWQSLYHRGISSGQPFTFEYYSEPLGKWFLIVSFIPSSQHIAFIYLDTTETKRQEQLIIESETRYRSLVKEANAIIVILNQNGEITFMNDYGLNFFGFRAEDVLGRSVFGTLVRVDGLKPKTSQQLFRVFQLRIKRHHRGMVESLTSSGQRVLVDWTVQECRDFTGDGARFVAVGIDAINARKSQREMEKRMERQKRRSLFNDAVNRRISQSELVGAARQLGITLASPYVFGLLNMGGDRSDNGRNNLEPPEYQGKMDNLIELLQPWDAGAVWRTRDGIAVVLSQPEAAGKTAVKQTRNILDDLIRRVSQSGFTPGRISAGCAHSTHPMQSIAELYDQAFSALYYGPVVNPGQNLHHWDELGFYQFIVKDLRTGMARQFVEDQLGPLLQMNRTSSREELMDTLKEIVSGRSTQLIAENLHIHRQTLVFRKKGLEKILGVDLDSSEVILNIAIAIRMMSMTEHERNASAGLGQRLER